MLSRRHLIPLAAGAALLAPAAAHATDYCVQPAATCAPANTYPQSGAGVQAALDAAVANDDRVLLGAATYTAPTTAGFKYLQAGIRIQVVGAGSASTVLTGPDDTTTTLTVASAAGTVVRDLGVRIPKRVANAFFLTGLNLVKGQATRVAVTSDPALNGTSAVVIGAATFEDGSVTLPAGNSIVAINPSADGATVRNSTIVAGGGVNPHYADFTLDHSRVTALTSGAYTSTGLGGRITDSVLTAAAGATGVGTTTQNGTDAAVRVDHSTIVGAAGAVTGVYANGSSNGHTATVDVHDSIVRGFMHGRVRATNGAQTTAGVATTYSAVTDTAGDQNLGMAGGGAITSAHDLAVDPQFVDEAGGDFHLKATSPALDAGDPAGLLMGEPALDFTGSPRIADGDNTCGAVSDLGAYELPRTLPVAAAALAAGSSPTVGQPVSVSGAGSSSVYSGAITYAWSFDDGGTAAGPSVTHVFGTPGAHTATLTVTDACGLAGTPAVVPVSVKAVDSSGGATQTPAPTKDTVRPALSRLGLSARRFAVGRVGTRTAHRTPRGTTLKLTSSEASALTITVRRRVAGHRAGKACRSGAPRRGSGAKRCTVLRTVGTLKAQAPKGDVRVPFDGRVGGRALGKGAYVVSVGARDAAGNVALKPLTAAFTIVVR